MELQDQEAPSNSADETVETTIQVGGNDFHLTFQDEFTTDQLIHYEDVGSDGRWLTSFSPHQDDTRFLDANGEGQYYVDPGMDALPQAHQQEDGILTITATPLTEDQQALAQGQEYASGLITTELSFAATAGYVEVSAQVSGQQGLLSSFWLLPQSGDWTSEIDGFEVLGSDPTTLNTNVWIDGNEDPWAIPTDDLSDGFHTYGVQWGPDGITWYLDGVAVRHSDTVITEPMTLHASVAVDTNWTGSPDETTDFSDGMQIDYIRVYEDSCCEDANDPIPGDNSFDPQDFFIATRGEDVIYGSNGDDRIATRAGDDSAYGRDGDDRIWGQSGSDDLYGGDGGDRIYGNRGDDHLYGHGGRDRLKGQDGADHLVGGDGADFSEWGRGRRPYVGRRVFRKRHGPGRFQIQHRLRQGFHPRLPDRIRHHQPQEI